MTKRFQKKFADYLSLAVAFSGAILAVSDTIEANKLIPPNLSNAWGLFLALSLIINRVGSILTHPAHQPEIQNARRNRRRPNADPGIHTAIDSTSESAAGPAPKPHSVPKP